MQKNLQIAHIDYSITTKSLDIFTIGCDGHCTGCCNPEIKSWDLKGLSVFEVLDKVMELNSRYDNLIERVIIVGGDPVDAYSKYPFDMQTLLKGVKSVTGKPVYLFTRHGLPLIPQDLKDLVDYIKSGEYKPELTCDDNTQYGIKLATSNQVIYKKENEKWIK